MTNKGNGGGAGDRRSAPRMALDAAAIIRFETVDADVRSRIINASRNGVLLAMPAPRPVGTRLHLTVRIAEPPADIKLEGIVVHVADNSQNASPGFGTQVGLFLTNAGVEWENLCRRLAETPGTILPDSSATAA
ncbi:MAG TPA: PilZ domain-containing protein [Polyangia bacterium]